MIENRTVFDLFKLPYDSDAFDHALAMIESFQPTRQSDWTKTKFTTVAEALKEQYPVSWFGSLNSSHSGALQANTQLLMPGYDVAKEFMTATAEDFDFIVATQHQPKWVTDICGSVQAPIAIGHQKGGNIEHDKTIAGNLPVWDGVTVPGEIVRLGALIHQYGFTLRPVAQAIADAVSRGVVLLKSVGDSVEGAHKDAIDCYSLILEAWIAKWPDGYPNAWQLWDPAPPVTAIAALAQAA